MTVILLFLCFTTQISDYIDNKLRYSLIEDKRNVYCVGDKKDIEYVNSMFHHRLVYFFTKFSCKAVINLKKRLNLAL